MLFTLVGLFAQTVFAQEKQVNSCVSCHLEIGDELALPVEGMKGDVHSRQGLSCADCHGGDPTAGLEDGDPEAAMDPAKGYIGVPKRSEIPQFCSRCHSDPEYMHRFNPRAATDQYDNYKTSIHGKLLLQGDGNVATCIDCHGVHGILNAKDARSSVYPLNIPATCGRCHSDSDYMAPYGIPTDQASEYRTSVHGVALLEKGDMAAPACNDCHGNHGATPPGAPSIAFICGQCHLNNSELFFQSPHKSAFDELELPECEACHGNHSIQHASDKMLGTDESSVCADCHDEGSEGWAIAHAMRQEIDTLKEKYAIADSIVLKAERAGMQVQEALFQLKDVNNALIKSRTMVHSFSTDKIKEVSKGGIDLAEQAALAGEKALAEVQFRRKGLALSLLFICALAVGLYMKIRDADKKHRFRQYER